MTDWKSELRKAAEDLALGKKIKSERPKPSSMLFLAQQVQSSSAPESPSRLSKPGRPEGAPIEVGNSAYPEKADSNRPSGSRSPDKKREHKKKNVKKKYSYQPTPLRLPSVTFPTNPYPVTRSELVSSKAVSVQRPEFRKPNMARFEIRHGSSTGYENQGWQQIGVLSSFQPDENRGRAQCIVGLDFGTAFTKACVQFRQSTYVVHWDRAIANALPFLLPGVFSVRSDGSCVLGMEPNGQVHGDLKMGLLTGARSDAKVLVTTFLALATRFIRSWLFTKHVDVFRGFQIEWFVNVGLPAAPWDNLHLRALYQEISLAGWRLGTTNGIISLDAATAALATVHEDLPSNSNTLQRARVCAFPEFVAQINSYRRSAQRRLDLHLLVDVGAGTVDIVTFHVWEPEDGDCYSILEAAVEIMGTHILLGYRSDAAALRESQFDEALSRLSVGKFEAKFGLSVGKLRPAQDIFADQIRWFLESLLRRTRSNRYGPSPAWKTGIPFFLAGGGNQVDAYRQAVLAINKDWRLEEIVLPLPDGIVPGQLTLPEFHRVSVAYGLSDSADNIGLIDRKSEVPDLNRVRVATAAGYSDRYIEK